MRVLGAVLAGLVLGMLATLVVYVLGDDAYLDDGTSRWASRADDAEAQATFWSAVVLGAVAVPLLLGAARARRPILLLAGGFLAILAVAADAVAFVQFTAD